MKKILIYSLIALLLAGCEDFLDSENLMKKDNSNFPKDANDAMTALTGAYSQLRKMTPGEVGQNFFMTAELLSDDRFGGGGPDDRRMQAIDRLLKADENMFADVWKQNYAGIFRCNMLFESIPNIVWEDEAKKKQIEGETHFLRAYFYFDLCRLFGRVPLITVTGEGNLPKASADELFAQIGSDLNTAIGLLPDVPYTQTVLGHATKWAAEALLARVWLFYTGYYEKEAMPLVDGGSLSRKQVSDYLDDCIAHSGHELLRDYRSLWPYSNEYTKDEYPYMDDVDATWAGDKIENTETVFAIKYSTKANWDNNNPWCNNENCLYFSLREGDAQALFPFGIGYGVGTVNSALWDEWKMREPKDIRRQASILNVEDELPDYSWGADKQMNETGFWQKKYLAINAHDDDGECVNFAQMEYPGLPSDYQLNNVQDLVIIRYADVLLMSAELKKDAGPLNDVRNRVGLPPVTYSDAALRNERHWELAFEGLRYYDLLRWHIAGETLNKQNGVEVQDNNSTAKMNMGDLAKRIQETGGFLPIPKTQIDLSAGVLEQNPGWSADNLLY